MIFKHSDRIEEQVIKNSLTAMEQSASKGDSKSVIRLAKFLLKTFNKRNDVSVEIIEKKTVEDVKELKAQTCIQQHMKGPRRTIDRQSTPKRVLQTCDPCEDCPYKGICDSKSQISAIRPELQKLSVKLD